MEHRYQHEEYTDPAVYTLGVTEGWAEAETDPTRINWPERQARAAIPFVVINGRPVNPCEKTQVRRGRNQMGFWGEQKMADAVVVIGECSVPGAPRWLLMVERDDGYGWAVPGGHVEPGEGNVQAAARELLEETGLDEVILLQAGSPPEEKPARYVPDPRASDEAWAVTVPVVFRLGTAGPGGLPAVQGLTDARRAAWVPAPSFEGVARSLAARPGGRVFAAHVAMLQDFLGITV